MAKKIITLEKNQSFIKNLYNGDLVTINHHDYYYKGVREVTVKGTIKKNMLCFSSTSTDFKRFFDLNLLDHVVTQKSNDRELGFNW